MKKLTKKTAVMLVVAMLLAMLPVSAFAAYTPDWSAASIVLTDNVDLADMLTIDHDLALDLAGKTITAAADKNGIEVVNGATLTITDSVGGGKIVASGSGYSAVRAGRNVNKAAESAGHIVLNGGAVEAPAGYGITVWASSSLVVNGGSVSGGVTAISGNGDNHGASITVNGGTVNGTGLGIYAPGNGTLTIAGGSVTGGNTGVEVRGGSITVTGGTITGNGPDATAANGSGSTVSGAAVAVSPYAGNTVTANIQGGTLSAPNGTALAEKDTVNGAGSAELSVSGGTLSGAVATETDTNTGFITGGTLSGAVQQGDLADNKTVGTNGAVECDHVAKVEWDMDAAAHWHRCQFCNEICTTFGEHFEVYKDGRCDDCGWYLNETVSTGRANPSTGVGFFAWLRGLFA